LLALETVYFLSVCTS